MKWNDSLKSIIGKNADMDQDALVRAIAKSMEEKRSFRMIAGWQNKWFLG